MLFADEPCPVPACTQQIGDVALRVSETVTPVGQSNHPGRMGALPGQQRCARTRAHGGGGERLTEQHTLVGQVLDLSLIHI